MEERPADFWDRGDDPMHAAPPVPVPPAEPSRESSGASDSDSSDSVVLRDEGEGRAVLVPDVVPAAIDLALAAEPAEPHGVVEHGDDGARAPRPRTRVPEVFKWGPKVEFTWKAAKGASAANWQCRCLAHLDGGRDGCRRTRSLLDAAETDPSSDGSLLILRRLKLWAMGADPALLTGDKVVQ